ncbi:MAG: hypothetical protein H6943_07830 [Zoogloeaceae bacterium]|nr:hypothetical protein [Zoogloeaceae bacterium]
MQPIHDVDVIVLLAILLSSKRRPAELAEVVAAADFIQGVQGTLPSVVKLRAAFARLSEHSLINEADGGFALTPIAQKTLAGGARKATTSERLFAIKEKLGAYTAAEKGAVIDISEEQLSAAIATHRAAGEGAGQNLLIPKPKAAEDDRKKTTGPGLRQRKPLPARRRKD